MTSPMATHIPTTPSARPRSSAGKIAVTMPELSAISMHAPTACSTRAPISQPRLGASPQSAEETVKSAAPIR